MGFDLMLTVVIPCQMKIITDMAAYIYLIYVILCKYWTGSFCFKI